MGHARRSKPAPLLSDRRRRVPATSVASDRQWQLIAADLDADLGQFIVRVGKALRAPLNQMSAWAERGSNVVITGLELRLGSEGAAEVRWRRFVPNGVRAGTGSIPLSLREVYRMLCETPGAADAYCATAGYAGRNEPAAAAST